MSEEASLDEIVEIDSEVEGEFVETAAGQLPVDWDTKNVDELCALRNGKATNHTEIGEQQFLVYGSNGPIGSSLLSNFHGGLIFGRVGAVGEVERVREPVWVSDNAIRASVTDNCNTDFIYYFLSHEELSNLATKTAQPLLNQSTISHITVPSPPLPEQRKIASVLYTVDQAIQKSENIIQQIKTIKQGIFKDFIYGAGSDRQFEDKMIGPRVVSLPKDWKVVQIEDALQRNIIFEQQDGNHGNNYPRKNEFVDRGVPYISAEMLSEGEVDFSKAKYLTEERANQLRIGFAKNGDVLLAHNATVGPTGLLETTSDFVIIGTSLTYYRCNPNEVSNQYMTYFFQSGTFQKQLQDVMRQSTRNQVPITRQRNLHLILPPIRQQREITNQIDAVNQKLQTENQYLGGFKRLKRGLMQDLLSGTVRTTDTNIEVPDEIMQYG